MRLPPPALPGLTVAALLALAGPLVGPAHGQGLAEARPASPVSGTRPPQLPSRLSVGFGLTDVWQRHQAANVRVEYRHRDALPWRVQPVIGVDVGDDASAYGFFGLQRELPVGRWVRVIPGLALGRYRDGDRALGHPLEFRSGLELAVVLRPGMQLGVAFHHLSNASLGRINPGTEQLMMLWSVPLR